MGIFSLNNIDWNEIKKTGTRKTAHAVFISSLLMLALLVSWWAVFINRSIEESHAMKLENLYQNLNSLATSLGYSQEKPEPGLFRHDTRYEITTSGLTPQLPSRRLGPRWEDLSIRPHQSYLETVEGQYHRQKFMIFGESILVVILILVSGSMIYRMYLLERRTTHELHEFWSRVSHEIKTPITGLRAFLETLQTQDIQKDEMEPLVKLALKQIDRQQQLAENMLVGQKLKKKGIGIKLERINLKEFLENFFRYHVTALSTMNNNFSYTVRCDDNISVEGDPVALKVIFDNLVDNSMKYAGTDLQITIDINKDGKNGKVIFRDNGPGIPDENKEIVFKAYKRLKNELPGDKHHGTGMGLYISRQLARRMNGNLETGSRMQQNGAVFVLYLKLTGNG